MSFTLFYLIFHAQLGPEVKLEGNSLEQYYLNFKIKATLSSDHYLITRYLMCLSSRAGLSVVPALHATDCSITSLLLLPTIRHTRSTHSLWIVTNLK